MTKGTQKLVGLVFTGTPHGMAARWSKFCRPGNQWCFDTPSSKIMNSFAFFLVGSLFVATAVSAAMPLEPLWVYDYANMQMNRRFSTFVRQNPVEFPNLTHPSEKRSR
jgi:hypothetical protein